MVLHEPAQTPVPRTVLVFRQKENLFFFTWKSHAARIGKLSREFPAGEKSCRQIPRLLQLLLLLRPWYFNREQFSQFNSSSGSKASGFYSPKLSARKFDMNFIAHRRPHTQVAMYLVCYHTHRHTHAHATDSHTHTPLIHTHTHTHTQCVTHTHTHTKRSRTNPQ